MTYYRRTEWSTKAFSYDNMKVALISCVKTKLPQAAPAGELYVSALFKGNLRLARRLGADKIFILSAKHGLLDLDTMIEPYEETLKGKPANEVRAWAERVRQQLAKETDLSHDHFLLLAGMPYRKFLVPSLGSYETPLENLSMGQQLKYLASVS